MTGELYTYDSTHLTLIRDGTVELTQRAELGGVGSGSFAIDDTTGSLSIVGQKDFSVTQSGCATPLMFRGFIGARSYGRDAGTTRQPHVGAGRGIGVGVEDLNAMLGFRRIRTKTGMTTAEGGKRPAETVADRGAWLMASPFVVGLFADNGRCDFPADKGMDASDYRNQHPGDVLADMALASHGYNYYVSDWGSGPELTFRDDNASTADTSTLRISNVLSDASSVTLNPYMDATLTRDPSQVISDVGLYYANGSQTLESAATASNFNGERGATVSNSNIKTSAKALDEATSILFQRSTEEDKIECTVLVTDAQVNLILHGMRIQAKFSHLATEGYGSFTYFRVVERTVKPIVADGLLYELRLTLSPQEAGPPVPVVATIVQAAPSSTGAGGGYASFANPVTIGNLLVWMGTKRDTDDLGPVAPNTDVAQPRWGAGAWTDATPGGLVKVQWDDPRAYQEGMKLFWKIADDTSSMSGIDEFTTSVCWEIANATMSGATIVSQTLQGLATTHAIGSLGTPSSGAIGLLMLSLGAGAADPVTPSVALNPGVWVRDYHADGFEHVWNSDSNTIGFNQPAPPETWLGHTISDGTALAATLTDAHSHKWGGIAVLLA